VGGVNESCDASEAERSFAAELCRMAENGNQDSFHSPYILGYGLISKYTFDSGNHRSRNSQKKAFDSHFLDCG
jgi:hypothetical protein